MKLEDLKVGQYVRTKLGIGKIVSKVDDINDYYYNCWIADNKIGSFDNTPFSQLEYFVDNEVIKASYNIIDILEVGDYVNGLPVECVEGTRDDENDKRVYYGVATYGYKSNLPYHTYIVKDEFENDYNLRFRCIKPNEIKSIVTKEQMEQMAYKVGK